MDKERIETFFFLALLLAAAVLAFFIFVPYIGVVVIAATFAIVFEPLYRKFQSFLRAGKRTAALLTIAVVILLVCVPLFFFGFQVIQEARDLYASLLSGESPNTALHKAVSFIRDSIAGKIGRAIPLDVSVYASYALEWLLGNLGAVFSSVAQLTFSFFLTFIALYYFLKDGEKFEKAIRTMSPLSDRYNEEIISRLKVTINSVFKGSLVVAFIQGLLVGIGFLSFGVPNPALWGSVGVFASLIPTVGTAVVVAPGVIYLLATGELFNAIALIAWGIVVVGLVDNFIRPKLIERDVNIHPFFVLLSVLGGIGLFGPVGFLLGPLVLSFLFTLFDIYQSLILKR
jgi:predicted PurR-regulated permease PerM